MYHQRMIFLPKEKMSEIPTIMDSSVLTEDRWTVYIPVAGLEIGDLDIEMNNDTITINCDMNYQYGLVKYWYLRVNSIMNSRFLKRSMRWNRSFPIPKGLDIRTLEADLGEEILQISGRMKGK